MILMSRFDCYPRHDQPALVAECVRIAESVKESLQVRSLRTLVHVSGQLPVAHPAYIRLTQLRDQHGLDMLTLPAVHFTKEEMERAELFDLCPDNYIRQDPEEVGTQFQRVTCPQCRLTYRVQKGPLLLKSARLQGLRWIKPYGDDIFLVSPELADLFSQWELSGVGLDEVWTPAGKRLPVVQVRPTWILPELALSTPFQTAEVCSGCRRFGRAPWQLHYRRSDLGVVQDLGFAPVYYSMNPFTTGKLIISRRLLDLMKKARVRGYKVEPIAIVD